MNSLRESLVSIPGALTNLITESASNATNYVQSAISNNSTTTTSSTPTTEDASSGSFVHISNDKSLPIPAALVKEQWRLIFTSDANAQDLEAAIKHCRDLVLLTEECSEERRWLVRHLVDLRYSLNELKAAEGDALECAPSVKTVVGHHFVINARAGKLQEAATRYYCDHCSGIIWSVVQSSYVCKECDFMAHQKCIDSVVRVCAHVIASERQYPITSICPEIGLAAQQYKCAECGSLLNFKNSWIEPRLCDYNGLYYCPSCHWNDNSLIPARIVHNWDFQPRKVSRASMQEIKIFLDKPLIKLEEVNPKLFVFLEKLCTIKKIRQNLIYMRKYLMECRNAKQEKLISTQIGSRRHLIQSNIFYSINDMEQTENGLLAEFLHKVFNIFDRHIRACDICTAKAYICEICSNLEVIFPHDDGCIICDKCNSIYHRVCLTRKNMICPKCMRLQERKLQMERCVNTTDKTTKDDDAADDDNHNNANIANNVEKQFD